MKHYFSVVLLVFAIHLQSIEYNVGWQDYNDKMEALAQKVVDSGWEFDQILCVARGGLLVGAKLSHKLEKPLAVIMASSYEGDGEREQGGLKLSTNVTAQKVPAKSVLLLDDLVDSGVTLAEIKKFIEEQYPGVEVKTGVIFKKPLSKIDPDFYVEIVDQDVWITQPFEI